jgi:hypothetical protein
MAKSKAIDLRSISTMQEALAALASAGVPVESIDAYGDGAQMAEKANLIGVPMLLTSWSFAESDYDKESVFVIVKAITDQDVKVIFVDGSTGIRAQLWNITEERSANGVEGDAAYSGLICPRGLRVSEYTYTDDKGKSIPASTYYLD